MSQYPLVFFLGCIMCTTAFPEPNPVYDPSNPAKVIRPTYRPDNPPIIVHPTYNPKHPPKFIRVRRFTDSGVRFGDGQICRPQQSKPTWEVIRDRQGNTKAKIDIQNHDFGAGYEQTIRGPGKRF